MLDIPYTRSDPLTLAFCLDKVLTKKLVAIEGVKTPGWLVIGSEAELEEATWEKLRLPVIVKPAAEGSSKGIRLTSLAHDIGQAREEAGAILVTYRQPVMAEEFIDGDEVPVGMV